MSEKYNIEQNYSFQPRHFEIDRVCMNNVRIVILQFDLINENSSEGNRILNFFLLQLQIPILTGD